MTAESSSPAILLFTTSQTPLPVRYRRPHKPVLVLPPLLHRSLHAALDADSPSVLVSGATVVIPKPDSLAKHDKPFAQQDTEYELTVKVHLVGGGSPAQRSAWVDEALDVLSRDKGLGGVDNLLVGWGGIDYKGEKTIASEFFGCGAEGWENGSGSETVPPEREAEVLETWKLLERLQWTGADGSGRIKRLGTLYLPLQTLRLLSEQKVSPKINAMDTPDCHHLPAEYSEFARGAGIELWAGGGGEGADPLPAADLHNLLEEFRLVLAPLCSSGTTSLLPRSLGKPVPIREDGLKWDDKVSPGVAIRWVLGYTLVSRTRNVVADKGYVVAADFVA